MKIPVEHKGKRSQTVKVNVIETPMKPVEIVEVLRQQDDKTARAIWRSYKRLKRSDRLFDLAMKGVTNE